MAMGTNGVTGAGAGAVVVVGGNERVGQIATCGWSGDEEGVDG